MPLYIINKLTDYFQQQNHKIDYEQLLLICQNFHDNTKSQPVRQSAAQRKLEIQNYKDEANRHIVVVRHLTPVQAIQHLEKSLFLDEPLDEETFSLIFANQKNIASILKLITEPRKYHYNYQWSRRYFKFLIVPYFEWDQQPSFRKDVTYAYGTKHQFMNQFQIRALLVADFVFSYQTVSYIIDQKIDLVQIYFQHIPEILESNKQKVISINLGVLLLTFRRLIALMPKIAIEQLIQTNILSLLSLYLDQRSVQEFFIELAGQESNLGVFSRLSKQNFFVNIMKACLYSNIDGIHRKELEEHKNEYDKPTLMKVSFQYRVSVRTQSMHISKQRKVDWFFQKNRYRFHRSFSVGKVTEQIDDIELMKKQIEDLYDEYKLEQRVQKYSGPLMNTKSSTMKQNIQSSQFIQRLYSKVTYNEVVVSKTQQALEQLKQKAPEEIKRLKLYCSQSKGIQKKVRSRSQVSTDRDIRVLSCLLIQLDELDLINYQQVGIIKDDLSMDQLCFDVDQKCKQSELKLTRIIEIESFAFGCMWTLYHMGLWQLYSQQEELVELFIEHLILKVRLCGVREENSAIYSCLVLLKVMKSNKVCSRVFSKYKVGFEKAVLTLFVYQHESYKFFGFWCLLRLYRKYFSNGQGVVFNVFWQVYRVDNNQLYAYEYQKFLRQCFKVMILKYNVIGYLKDEIGMRRRIDEEGHGELNKDTLTRFDKAMTILKIILEGLEKRKDINELRMNFVGLDSWASIQRDVTYLQPQFERQFTQILKLIQQKPIQGRRSMSDSGFRIGRIRSQSDYRK